MKTLVRALVWAATLVAATDCPAAAARVRTKCDTLRAPENPKQNSDQDSRSELHQQCPSPCAMTDGRRVRQSRSRCGFGLDDWIATVLDCVRWVGDLLGSC